VPGQSLANPQVRGRFTFFSVLSLLFSSFLFFSFHSFS
jgi:hypothetical protein